MPGARQCPIPRRSQTAATRREPDALAEATTFVRVIHHRQGLKIACQEEIAYAKKWITKAEFLATAGRLGKTEYAVYLKKLAQ